VLIPGSFFSFFDVSTNELEAKNITIGQNHNEF